MTGVIKKTVQYMPLLVSLIVISCSTKTSIPVDIPEHPSVSDTVSIPEPETPETKTKSQLVRITGVGDIMLGTHFPSSEYLPPDDGIHLLSAVSPILKQSDITFGNLEGSLLNEGECIKKCSDPEKCYAFKMPESYSALLSEAGFNLLSIANNHIGDFGLKGRERTVTILRQNSIHTAGIDSVPFTVFEHKNLTYGFAAFSPNAGIPDIRDIDSAEKTVRHLATLSDIVIVSFHGGAEGAENRHVTRQDEFFYGENRGNVYEFSHRMIDAGADIVFGHGPHITRAVELYKNRFIAYSLGNFCTYARFNLRGHNGIAPMIQINTDSTGTFVSGKIIPLVQEYKKGPVIDSEKRAISEIIELSTTDFPESPVIITPNGDITGKHETRASESHP